MPYEAALAGCVIAGIGYLLPALLGVPLVPGWITPAIPVVLLYLQNFEPGPEAVKAISDALTGGDPIQIKDALSSHAGVEITAEEAQMICTQVQADPSQPAAYCT